VMCGRLTRLMFVQYSAAGYERMKISVYKLRLNTDSDGDDETKGGKLFQTRAAKTENARSRTTRRVLRSRNRTQRLFSLELVTNEGHGVTSRSIARRRAVRTDRQESHCRNPDAQNHGNEERLEN